MQEQFTTTVTVTDSTGSAVNLSGCSHAGSRYVSHTIHPLQQHRSLQRPLMHQRVNLPPHYQTHKQQDLMVDTYMMSYNFWVWNQDQVVEGIVTINPRVTQ